MSQPLNIGDVLYGTPPAYHRNSSDEILAFTIDTVGRKYFTVKEESNKRFLISTLREDADYNYRLQLYRSEQEILDLRRHHNLSSELSCLFGGWNFYSKLTLDQMERISAIVNEPKAQ